jgi:hypothetical protein
MSLSRDVINALLPEGAAWEPESGGDYDNLLNGIAANSEAVRVPLSRLRNLRNPAETSVLSDLEAEYGIIPTAGATTAERRDILAAFMFRRGELPTYDTLQDRLIAAGFTDARVHVNSPTVDPATFILQAFMMTCEDLLPGGNDPQCGEPEAMCASLGGELLVNGEIFTQAPNYTIQCDETLAECGEPLATAGEFDGVTLTPIEYEIPVVAGYWPLIFFVGGDATRDPVTDAITDIDTLTVPAARRLEFRRIILKYKPMHSWAALVVAYG